MQKKESIPSSESARNACAVIVTHNPDEKLCNLIQSLEEQITKIIIVDNATKASNISLENAMNLPPVVIQQNTENLGIGNALNRGLETARSLGFQWAITFDQDSQPDQNLVDKYFSVLQSQEDKSNIAIVAPQVLDATLERKALYLRQRSPFGYERSACKGSYLDNVTTVITSGSMISLSAFEEVGDFREDFFIDYVDTEYCLRLLSHGYRIIVVCGASLQHMFGKREKVTRGLLTFYPSFHRPERWYTISRNRIEMIKSYGIKFPHWFLYELVASAYILFRMLLTEDQRQAKLSALLHGTWDGLRGRMGRPPWAE